MEKAGILVWLSSQTYKFDRSTNSTFTGFQLSRLSSYDFFYLCNKASPDVGVRSRETSNSNIAGYRGKYKGVLGRRSSPNTPYFFPAPTIPREPLLYNTYVEYIMGMDIDQKIELVLPGTILGEIRYG